MERVLGCSRLSILGIVLSTRCSDMKDILLELAEHNIVIFHHQSVKFYPKKPLT